MKILMGTDTYLPTINGAAQFCFRLARGLARLGHEVHILCPSPTGKPETVMTEQGLTLHRTRSVKYPGYRSFPLSVPGTLHRGTRRLLRELQPDIVHVQHSFLLGRALIEEARRLDIGVVATNHVMPENLVDHLPFPSVLDTWARQRVWDHIRRVYCQANVVTTPTPIAATLFERATGLHAVAVSNGIDLSQYSKASPGQDGDIFPSALFVGRLDQEKRVDVLVRAMAKLPAEVPARLDIVGDGQCRQQWQGLVRDLGLGPRRVRFHGFLAEADLIRMYSAAGLFCMPSIAELQSLATLEAMATGLPVIAADAVALRHLVYHDHNGYLHRPSDVDELAGHLMSLLTSAQQRIAMGDRSRKLVEAHSIENTLTTYLNLYSRVRDGVSTEDLSTEQTTLVSA